MTLMTPRELAYSVNRHLGGTLTPRPWNLHDPDQTLWWLVPTTQWPAYRHGKLAISLAHDYPRKTLLGRNDSLLELDKVFVGLNVEKGYGKAAIEVDLAIKKKPQQILDPDWLWFSLIEGKGPLLFSRLIESVSGSQRIYLYVIVLHVHDRETTYQKQYDAIVFSCHPDRLEHIFDNKSPLSVLKGSEKAKNFSELAECLRRVGEYHWVDLYLGAHLPRNDIDFSELDRSLLSHLMHWVV